MVYDSIPTINTLLVLEEIVKGINDYRYTLALRYYREHYPNLSAALKADLDGKINTKLVIKNFSMVPPPPPPPPEIMEVLEELEEEEIDHFHLNQP